MSLSDDELQPLLLAAFADEAREQLQTINKRLVSLEEAKGDEKSPLLEEILREVHSLKGASRAVDVGRVEAVAHKLESVFSAIQKGDLEADAEVFDVAYEGLDALTALVEEGIAGTPADVDMEGICDALIAAAEGGSAPAETDEPKPAADHAPAKPKEKKPAAQKADQTVRVATSKLDALMAQVGELLATRIRAEHRMAEVRALCEAMLDMQESWRESRPARTLQLALDGDEGALADARDLVEFLRSSDERMREVRNGLGELRRTLEADSRRMARVATDLQDDLRRARMLPVSTIFDAFPRMVRDMTRELSKEVKLTIEGGETEADKQVLEQLRSPLTHVVRNSVDHGIEMPDAREAAGKPRNGKVVLRAFQRAADLVIQVVDDGAGIDVEKLKAKAIEKGLITAENADGMSEREALWLIFRSGFSTKQEVTALSGRGVGMDVVREHIERLHGMIDVESTLGEGSKFTLSVPLSVATTRCLPADRGRLGAAA